MKSLRFLFAALAALAFSSCNLQPVGAYDPVTQSWLISLVPKADPVITPSK